MKYKRCILWGISDPHAWFKLGLLNPETKIHDPQGKEVGVNLTSSQQFLWEVLLQGKQEVTQLAGKDDIHVFSIGDITHGNKYISEQVSTQVSAQIEAAMWNFSAMLDIKNVRSLRMAVGTPSHAFGEGSADVLVSEQLKWKYPKLNIRVMYHGLCELSGVQIDFAHHGPTVGRLPWTKGNGVRNYLKAMLQDDFNHGRPLPDLVLRGHYHEYVKEWGGFNDHEAWMVVMPPMSLLGDFGTQAMRSINYVAPGTVAFEIINGHLHNIHPFTRTLDIREVETIG